MYMTTKNIRPACARKYQGRICLGKVFWQTRGSTGSTTLKHGAFSGRYSQHIEAAGPKGQSESLFGGISMGMFI